MYFFLFARSSNTYIPVILSSIIIYCLYIIERSTKGSKSNVQFGVEFLDLFNSKSSYANLLTLYMKNYLNREEDEPELHMDSVLNHFKMNSTSNDADDTVQEVRKMIIYNMDKGKVLKADSKYQEQIKNEIGILNNNKNIDSKCQEQKNKEIVVVDKEREKKTENKCQEHKKKETGNLHKKKKDECKCHEQKNNEIENSDEKKVNKDKSEPQKQKSQEIKNIHKRKVNNSESECHEEKNKGIENGVDITNKKNDSINADYDNEQTYDLTNKNIEDLDLKKHKVKKKFSQKQISKVENKNTNYKNKNLNSKKIIKPKNNENEIHSTSKVNESEQSMKKKEIKPETINKETNSLDHHGYTNKTNDVNKKDRTDSDSSEDIKAETEKKRNYLIKIKKLIDKKTIYEQRKIYFQSDVSITKNKMDKYFEQLKANFLNFLIMSKKIKDELVGVDIFIDNHLFDMNTVQDSLYRKFYLFNENRNEDSSFKFEDQQENEHENSIALYKKEEIGPIKTKEPLTKNIINFYKTMNTQEKKIKKSQTKPADPEIETMETFFVWIKFIFIIQGLSTFGLLIMCLINVNTLSYITRLIMIPIVILNIIIGIHLLLMAEVFDKKCVSNNITTCNKNKDLSVDEIIYQINAILELDENSFDAIEKTRAEFARLTLEYQKESKDLEIYLIRNAYNHINNTIEPIKAMFRNIKLIKNDFDEIMKKKINKKEYFFLISRMEILFESMISLFRKPNFGAVLSFFQYAVELKLEFSKEKDEFSNMIAEFELDDAKKMKSGKNDICSKDIQKVCRASKIFDEIYFIVLFLAPLFLFFLCV